MSDPRDRWPALPLAAWRDTYETLHMYAQVVGKVRLAATPRTNQLWNSALSLSARGLTTGALPSAEGTFECALDLVAHQLVITTSRGATRTLPLGGPVRAFYHGVVETLEDLGISLHLWPQPVEVPNPIRFDADDRHIYDPASVQRFFTALSRVWPVFETFRSRSRKLTIGIEPFRADDLVSVKQVDPAELSTGEFYTIVRRAVEGHGGSAPAKVIVIDSLNGYLNAMPEEKFLTAQLHELLAYLGQNGVVTIMTVTQSGMIGAMHSPIDTTYLADNVILFRFFEALGQVRRAVSVASRLSRTGR